MMGNNRQTLNQIHHHDRNGFSNTVHWDVKCVSIDGLNVLQMVLNFNLYVRPLIFDRKNKHNISGHTSNNVDSRHNNKRDFEEFD